MVPGLTASPVCWKPAKLLIRAVVNPVGNSWPIRSHDCFALLAASAGQRPREVLGGRGIRVILTEENIEGSVDVLYGGGKKQKCKK